MSEVRRYERGKLVGYVAPAEIPASPWGVAAPAPIPEPPPEPELPPAPTLTTPNRPQGRTPGGQFARSGSKFGFDMLEPGQKALVPDIDGLPRPILQRRICWCAIAFRKRYGMVIRTRMVPGGVEIERIE